MYNLLWGLLFVAVNFGLFLACYRLFGKKGLFVWVALATVLANIQVVKTIELAGIVATLGNTIYATVYLATDLINEKHGEKEARQVVWFGFFTLIATMVMMQMVLAFQPQPSDIAQDALVTIFGMGPRLVAASLSAYLVSQFLDVKLFAYLKQWFPARSQLWLRMNGSSGVSQLVDTLVFCTIAFAGLYSLDIWLEILVTTYVLKFVISAAATPVLYMARRFRHPADEAPQA
ncbi:queuosine precursor transporter [Paenibacillus sp. 1P07SE]|uniref:queuosine precursor transporter n=1 Tax=Paenibacillus sp. 1P07SE TaxID=3132209 RepID=UPI0039A4E09A